MATAYHLEALRKQRTLDRALEARQRLQQEAEEKQGKHHHHHHHHHHHAKRQRPSSAQAQPVSQLQSKKNKSSRSSRSVTPLSAGQRDSTSPLSGDRSPIPPNDNPVNNFEELDALKEQNQGTASHLSSHPSSSRKTGELELLEPGSHGTSRTPSAASSHHTTSTKSHTSASKSRASTASHTSSVSRMSCTTCSSSCATSSCVECMGRGRTSQTPSAIAERKADQVRKDLHKQEMVLRDSNLVMGPISLEQELHIRKMQE